MSRRNFFETEAYLETNDSASHLFRRQTRRNAAIFSAPGFLYVYTIRAEYCLHFTTEREGVGAAVLIGALTPIWGISEMQHKRNKSDFLKLTGGPATLFQALEINLLQNGSNLKTLDYLVINAGEKMVAQKIAATSRIGISRGRDIPPRFVIAG